MATIVQSKRNGKKYVLLGTGFGAYKSTRPGVFFGNLIPDEQEGQITMVAVCSKDGNGRWTHSDDLTVIEVDGSSPSELLTDEA
ncbi:MAG: hypothetical protein CMJ64_21730 [Planctomycetaceae bacterium]|nr:hypothetical protein [Planctomycetaceae bacterium]